MERINSQTILAKRRSKQRKQKLVRGLAIVLALMVIWKFFGSAVTWIRQWQSDEVYDVSAENMSVHGEKEKAPKKFSEAQITNELSRLSKKNQTYESIYNNRAEYPTVLLRSLCNNSEMLNFVAGYLIADKSAHGELTKKNVRERYLFCCNGIEDGDMYPMGAVILVYRAVLRLVCQW